ncbi:MAG TPA: PspC domain-containing protein [Jiangellales bacterium]|nr:PspC domain-containing protein [Jiangellales bacterium]
MTENTATQSPTHPYAGPSPDPAATPGPTPQAPYKRLTRSRTERMLGGVCGGLAQYLGVDPTLVRLGVVALTIVSGGAGLVAYVAAWIVVPEE